MLSKGEIERAVYLDFESEGQKLNGDTPPPVLGGARIEGTYTPTLLHSTLADAATSRGWKCVTLEEYLHSLHNLASSEGRHIVYFSSTEQTLFDGAGIKLLDIGFDLRKPAKSSKLYASVWKEFKAAQKQYKDRNTSLARRASIRTKSFGLLTLIAQEIGLKRPGAYGAGFIGKYIRSAMDQAEKKPCYKAWSKSGKTKLTKVVNHNEHDCHATQFVLEHLYRNTT